MDIAYHQACINGMITAINSMELRLDDDGSPYNNKKEKKKTTGRTETFVILGLFSSKKIKHEIH